MIDNVLFPVFKRSKNTLFFFFPEKERKGEADLLESIHNIVKKQIFRKDRSNAVAKEKKLVSVKITRHNSTYSGNQTFMSIIIYLHPWLNFYLRDFNAIFLN